MKAIKVHEFGPPEAMRLEEVPDPQPGPGQVVVKVHAVGVNPVDTYIRAGLYPVKLTMPYTPGLDAAGVVESIGSGVSRCKVGDRVYTAGTVSGAYAEKALCEESQVHMLPEQVSFSQGAGVNVPYAAAYRALYHRAGAKAGEVVLVHGASGGVGIASVQLARAAGMTVIATAGTERGKLLVLEQGAHYVLDHHALGYLDQALALTDGHGVDVLLEMLANVNLGKDLRVLANGGRVVVIGSRGTVEIDPRDAMGRDASILGMSLFNASKREMASIHAALGAGLANGTLRPVVSRELTLAEAPAAHHAVLETSSCGKIVLIP
ncbi:NADPH:quinone reductase [Geotalea uraniireducens]|uniref:Alcohol dehydrogenase, zinc-binding domain protein n=1 Tax=Geotalea uraniireducens (strain Rf4) TaxID=351605 RepID=A5G6Q1_GEOUR|nr:NADPH:quinone reductase [Geotalea uraniireducens]ABQ27469.1 Alcohol dehydrogenase, zinc-binding domain protein [Geotalea uraniireducens Rf4]